MNRREVNKIQSYLNESDSNSSLFSCGDDSDVDPDYGQSGPSQSRSMPTVHDLSDSDDNISVDESSSESSDNNSDTDSWLEDCNNIPEFNFDDSFSGIKLNISENARKFPLEIFNQLWTD